jgi:hypothetical protein
MRAWGLGGGLRLRGWDLLIANYAKATHQGRQGLKRPPKGVLVLVLVAGCWWSAWYVVCLGVYVYLVPGAWC